MPHLLLLSAALLFLPILSQAADWPQWRGPARDGHCAAEAAVPNTLPADPKVVWRLNIGGGFSSPVIADGKLLYLDTQEQKETAHLVDARTGKEIWQTPFGDAFQDEWGIGPRSTPIIDGDRVYVQSCKGEFRCLNLSDGKTIWGTSFEKDFGVKFLGSKQESGVASRRGNNGSGVIDGDRLILPVGSVQGASLVCFNKFIGKVLWKSQNDEAAYSSLMVATLAGVKQVVFLSAHALMGVELTNGNLLWRVPLKTDALRHAATPVIFGDTVIVNSHTFGLRSIKVSKGGAGQSPTELWANRDLKINLVTPVLVDHYLFSMGANKDYVCVDALTGKLMWRAEGFGDNYAATIAVGKNLLVQADTGDLVLVSADPARYTELGREQVCGKTWSHPAYVDGKLYVRDGSKLTCFDLMP